MTTTSRTTGDKLAKGAGGVVHTARQVADTVAGVAGEVSTRLPEAATTTKDAFDEAGRLVRMGSDDTLKIVGALSVGFAGGLFVAGANRLLVLAALIPAGLVASTFVERTNATSARRDRR